MTTQWEVRDLHTDPMVNAVLNVAAAIGQLARATDGLLYGLKYGKAQGVSIAEALEVGARRISSSVDSLASNIDASQVRRRM